MAKNKIQYSDIKTFHDLSKKNQASLLEHYSMMDEQKLKEQSVVIVYGEPTILGDFLPFNYPGKAISVDGFTHTDGDVSLALMSQERVKYI